MTCAADEAEPRPVRAVAAEQGCEVSRLQPLSHCATACLTTDQHEEVIVRVIAQRRGHRAWRMVACDAHSLRDSPRRHAADQQGAVVYTNGDIGDEESGIRSSRTTPPGETTEGASMKWRFSSSLREPLSAEDAPHADRIT